MNIIEAIKSGKRFKRKAHFDYWPKPNRNSHTFSLEELLADDWEVEEKQVTLTESDFESAAARASQSFSIYNPPHICEYLTQLKKELGL